MPPARGSWNADATASTSSERPSSGHDAAWRVERRSGEHVHRTGCSGWHGSRGHDRQLDHEIRRCRFIRLVDQRDEPISATVHGAHDVLGLPVVPDRAPCGLDARRERGLADEAVAPHVVEELFLGDHPLAVDDEIREDVEHLRFDGDRHPASAQLEERRVELVVTEAVDHGCGPRVSRRGV